VLAYRLLVDDYDPALDLDHSWDRGCRSKACCNPDHLEPVTHRENCLRGVRTRPIPVQSQSNPLSSANGRSLARLTITGERKLLQDRYGESGPRLGGSMGSFP
jgi:hypothetical protein